VTAWTGKLNAYLEDTGRRDFLTYEWVLPQKAVRVPCLPGINVDEVGARTRTCPVLTNTSNDFLGTPVDYRLLVPLSGSPFSASDAF